MVWTRRQHKEHRLSVPLEQIIYELSIDTTNQQVMNGGIVDATADYENSCDYDESDDNDSNRKFPIYELKETDIRANLENVRSDTAASGFQTVCALGGYKNGSERFVIMSNGPFGSSAARRVAFAEFPKSFVTLAEAGWHRSIAGLRLVKKPVIAELRLQSTRAYDGECYEFDRSEIINMTHGDAIKSDRGESGFKNVSWHIRDKVWNITHIYGRCVKDLAQGQRVRGEHHFPLNFPTKVEAVWHRAVLELRWRAPAESPKPAASPRPSSGRSKRSRRGDINDDGGGGEGEPAAKPAAKRRALAESPKPAH